MDATPRLSPHTSADRYRCARTTRSVGGAVRLVCVAVLLGSLWAAGCRTDGASATQDDHAAAVAESGYEPVLSAIEERLGALARAEAEARADAPSIEAMLAAPAEHFQDEAPRHGQALAALYEARGFEPRWISREGGSLRLNDDIAQLRQVLEEGVERDGLWPSDLRLETVRQVDAPRLPDGLASDLALTDRERAEVTAWLAAQDVPKTAGADLAPLFTEMLDSPGGPLPRVLGHVEERAEALSRLVRWQRTRDVLLSDAAVHYGWQMRFDNPAWLDGVDWPAELSTQGEDAGAKEMSTQALEKARKRHLLVEAYRPMFAGDAQVADVMRALRPPYRQYERLADAFVFYKGIVRAGGWPEVPESLESVSRGASHPDVPRLKERLRIEGYFGKDASTSFTRQLHQALIDYQNTHQLWPSGRVSPATRRSLNVSATRRWNQVRLSMQRWRNTRVGGDEHYVHVNVADFHAEIWRDGERQMRFKVIVGDTDRDESDDESDDGERRFIHSTPLFSDTIEYVVFNPYWNVPQSIINNELMPKINKDPSYLVDKNYEVVIDDNGHRIIRQTPGPGNALGQVKFLFPNKHDVYMHDTPDKHLFDKPFRAFSHGCVRVENPMEFAHYLLELDGRWGRDREERQEQIDEWLAKGSETWVNLRVDVPVHLEYFVVRVDDQGRANFLADLYRHDRPRLAQIAERLEREGQLVLDRDEAEAEAELEQIEEEGQGAGDHGASQHLAP